MAGVGAADITKLKANGYYTSADTIESVHAATRKTLLKVKGFSEVKVEKIKEAIAKLQEESMQDLDRKQAAGFYPRRASVPEPGVGLLAANGVPVDSRA
ncbi:MAG: hypothetical protein Q9161_007568 [Pseudevernia consocians]